MVKSLKSNILSRFMLLFENEYYYIHILFTEGIVLSPSSGDMLGGNKINITGPCVSPEYNITAYIVEMNTSVTCAYVNTDTSTCVFPPIFRTGEMTVQ